MGHRRAAFILIAACAAGAAAPAHAAANVRQGRPGAAFYSSKPRGVTQLGPGGLYWERRQTGPDALKSASTSELLLYRTVGVEHLVATSGSVSLPKGKQPRGGWPVVSWGHGTTGIADKCAPSRQPGTGKLAEDTDYVYPLLNRYLKAGFAVVRTDFQGLGTPGDHPFLNGRLEGNAMLDVVRAARTALPGKLSDKVVLAGHSQGGQAALWAGWIKGYAGLRIEGVSVFAPVSHLSEQAGALRALTQPSDLSALAALIFRGLQVGAQQFDVEDSLSSQAAALYPQTLTDCLPDLTAKSSFGGLAPAGLLKPDVDLAPLQKALDESADPENLRIPRPIQIAQGTKDDTVFESFTTQLSKQLAAKGAKVTYRTYPGVDHGGIVDAAAKASTAWIAKRLK